MQFTLGEHPLPRFNKEDNPRSILDRHSDGREADEHDSLCGA